MRNECYGGGEDGGVEEEKEGESGVDAAGLDGIPWYVVVNGVYEGLRFEGTLYIYSNIILQRLGCYPVYTPIQYEWLPVAKQSQICV